MSASKKYWWASYAIYNSHEWGFRELRFEDKHPFQLPRDNWPGTVFTLISFKEISEEEYKLHGHSDG